MEKRTSSAAYLCYDKEDHNNISKCRDIIWRVWNLSSKRMNVDRRQCLLNKRKAILKFQSQKTCVKIWRITFSHHILSRSCVMLCLKYIAHSHLDIESIGLTINVSVTQPMCVSPTLVSDLLLLSHFRTFFPTSLETIY